jgi:hypothetical protein
VRPAAQLVGDDAVAAVSRLETDFTKSYIRLELTWRKPVPPLLLPVVFAGTGPSRAKCGQGVRSMRLAYVAGPADIC